MSEGALRVSGYSTFDIRMRAVRAVIGGDMTVMDVAQAYGTDRSTIHRWLARFVSDGENGLERRPVPGRPRKLAGLDSDALVDIVLAPATQFGYETDFWTTRRLIQVIGSQFGVVLSK